MSMIVQLTTKGLKIDSATVVKIKNEFLKIGKYVPHLPQDLQLNVYIKKEVLKTGARTKAVLQNFDGWVKLIMPKKVLYSEFNGRTVSQGILNGKRNLRKELKKYKELHFKSQSKYPNHQTIRKDFVEE